MIRHTIDLYDDGTYSFSKNTKPMLSRKELEEQNNELNLIVQDYAKIIQELRDENAELEQKKNDLKELLTNAEPIVEQKKLQKIIYCILIHKIDDKINECKPIDEDNDVWDAETVGRINALKELRKELEGNAHEECFKNSN